MTAPQNESAKAGDADAGSHDSFVAPAVTRLPFWGALLASGALLVAFVAASPPDLSREWTHVGSAVAFYGATLSIWLISAKRHGASVRDVMGRGLRLDQVSHVLCAATAAFSSSIGWAALLLMVGLAPDSWRVARSETGVPVSILTTLLVDVALAPCVEEVLFRGMLFHRLLRYMRPSRAAVSSSLLFGLLHMSPVGATLFGLVLAVLYVRTGSLWVTTAAHILNNLLAHSLLLAELVLGRAVPISEWALAALLPLSLPWLVFFLRRGLRELDGAPFTAGAHRAAG